MTPEERNAALAMCIDEALENAAGGSATPWDAAYLQVLRDRLQSLLVGWMDLEMNRSMPFEVQLSEKDFKDVRVGPLRLNVRMDRIDEVECGQVLIDYKTGAAEPKQWLTE